MICGGFFSRRMPVSRPIMSLSWLRLGEHRQRLAALGERGQVRIAPRVDGVRFDELREAPRRRDGDVGLRHGLAEYPWVCLRDGLLQLAVGGVELLRTAVYPWLVDLLDRPVPFFVDDLCRLLR